MRSVFLVEKNWSHGSCLTGVHYNNGQLSTPPDDYHFPGNIQEGDASGGEESAVEVTAWLEIWDYAGGASFRAFVSETNGEKSLFVFFDIGVVGRDLKPSLMALIELAEAALGCSQMVICIDRSMPVDEAKGLMKGLQWAGFSPTTLDFWAGGVDVTSKRWLLMGMEI